GHGVAVVALLGRLDKAVAAVDLLLARRARGRADPAGLDVTARRAAVAIHRVAVVALLARLDHGVAAARAARRVASRRRRIAAAGAAVGRHPAVHAAARCESKDEQGKTKSTKGHR